jgi:Zn-dependent protease with chaperone function
MILRRFHSTATASSLALREKSHRRATLLGIAVLLILSTAPVVGHHLWASAAVPVTGLDHFGALCVVALTSLLSPVHAVFHVALGAGVVYACWDRWKSWRNQVQALSLLETTSPLAGEPFHVLAVAGGLDPSRLTIVDGLPNPAFTVGLFSPRVFVARGLLYRVSEQQVVAVLAHEAAHVRRRDPLRVAVYRFLACTLFWIPALRRLSDDMADEVEILADDAAAKGRPLVLASAILGLADWRNQVICGTVGFQRCDLLDRRIRRLAGENPPVGSHLTRRSVAGAAFALVLVVTSGAFAAPHMGEQRPVRKSHCLHRGESALRHLFCSGFHRPGDAAHCPHSAQG